MQLFSDTRELLRDRADGELPQPHLFNISEYDSFGILRRPPMRRTSGTIRQFHGDFLTELEDSPDDPAHIRWVWVPDNYTMVAPVGSGLDQSPEDAGIAHVAVKNKYECFDSFENMQTVMVNYINQSYYGGMLGEVFKGPCGYF